MQILVLLPQDSGETCLGILVRKSVTGTRHRHGNCMMHMHEEWLGEAMYPSNEQMLVTPTQVQMQGSKVY